MEGNTMKKTISCMAAVAYGPGEPFVLEKIQVDPPQGSEVRVRVKCTSLCRSDLTYWRHGGIYPRILGHEAAGIVESVGERVVDLKPGDRVLPLFTGECKECKNCKSGKTNLCVEFKVAERKVMRSDGKSRFSTMDGKPIYHFIGTSTFSEYTVVEEACVCKIEDEKAPLDKICLLSCGVTTGVGASINAAKVEKGSTVVIFGLGTIGCAAAQGAKIAGASRIIGVDILPSKLEQGKRFGLTDTLNSKELEKPVQEVIRDMTDGGADFCVECVGNVNLIRDAVESSHEGWGRTVVAGLDERTKYLNIHPSNFLYGRTLTGTFFGDYKGRTQLNDLVNLYMSKALDLDSFVTHSLPFSKINEGFQLLIEGKCLRCVLYLDEP